MILLASSACGQPYYFDHDKCAASFAAVQAKVDTVQFGTTTYANLKDTIMAGEPITLLPSSAGEVVHGVTEFPDTNGTVYWEPGNLESWCGTYLFRVSRTSGVVNSVEKYENYLQGYKP